jgi:hypothetical protein
MYTRPFPIGKRGRGQKPVTSAPAMLPVGLTIPLTFSRAPGDATGIDAGLRMTMLASPSSPPGGINH